MDWFWLFSESSNVYDFYYHKKIINIPKWQLFSWFPHSAEFLRSPRSRQTWTSQTPSCGLGRHSPSTKQPCQLSWTRPWSAALTTPVWAVLKDSLFRPLVTSRISPHFRSQVEGDLRNSSVYLARHRVCWRLYFGSICWSEWLEFSFHYVHFLIIFQ